MANTRYQLYRDDGPESAIQKRGIKAIANTPQAKVAKTYGTMMGNVAGGYQNLARGVTGAALVPINRVRKDYGTTPLGNPIPEAKPTPLIQPNNGSLETRAANSVAKAVPQLSTVAAHNPQTVAEPPAISPRGIRPSRDGILAYNEGNNMVVKGDIGKFKANEKRLGLPKTGAQRVGNMDVQFGPNAGDREAFLRDPIRPTAQMGRVQGGAGNVRPDYDWNKPQQPDVTDVPFTRESHPDMPWKTRDNLNQQWLANQGHQAIAQLGADTDITQTGIASADTRRGQDIQRLGIASENDLRHQQIAGEKLSIEDQTRLSDLAKRYQAETDPTKKKALADEYLTLSGKPQTKYQMATRKGVDENAVPYEETYLVDAEGNSRQVGAGQQSGEMKTYGQGETPETAGWVIKNGRPYYYDGKNYHEDMSTVKK